jgi:hypothetical protein
MKISEILQPKMTSAINSSNTQDVVAQDVVSKECISAIAEGITRILRRVKGKGIKTGFRCTSGVRKGRIVAHPDTCNARMDTAKGRKIAGKRHAKAGQTAIKAGLTKKYHGGSQQLKSLQHGHKKSSKGAPRLLKSKFIKSHKPKKHKKK